MKRPCLTCGEPSETSHCAACPPKDQRVRNPKHVHFNRARWKNLSLRVRRAMPWCQDCGATTHLQADHIVPLKARPDWAYELANLTVRCASCNGHKSDTMPSAQEIRAIEQQIARRRPRGKGSSVWPLRPGVRQRKRYIPPGGQRMRLGALEVGAASSMQIQEAGP